MTYFPGNERVLLPGSRLAWNVTLEPGRVETVVVDVVPVVPVLLPDGRAGVTLQAVEDAPLPLGVRFAWVDEQDVDYTPVGQVVWLTRRNGVFLSHGNRMRPLFNVLEVFVEEGMKVKAKVYFSHLPATDKEANPFSMDDPSDLLESFSL